MTSKDQYDFGEKTHEYSAKRGEEIPVWVSPKYTQSREKAVEIIDKYDNITAGDFWILMNETKTGKMAYTGLIISHNACLKINDHLEDKFKPSCMSLDKNGYNDSIVYTYINDEQGIYEVGEVSKNNCKNAYPYAMALKRCFDRVVLKLCKLAYDGVYSDSEADEFKDRADGNVSQKKGKVQVEDIELEPSRVWRDKVYDYCLSNGIAHKELARDYKLDNNTTEKRFKEVYEHLTRKEADHEQNEQGL